VQGGIGNMQRLSSSAKTLAQTNSTYQGQFLHIKPSNKMSVVCEVDQLELWQRELSIAGFGDEILHFTICECSQ